MSPLEATGQSRRFYRQHRHDEHARFVFLHPRGAYFIFFGEGEAGEESKNDRQIKISHSLGALEVSLSR